MGAERKLAMVRAQNGDRRLRNLHIQTVRRIRLEHQEDEEVVPDPTPMVEQMPDDDTLAPAPGHSREAARLGGSRIRMDSRYPGTREGQDWPQSAG